MTDQNIIQWMLEERIAHHPSQAANIANGLRLSDIVHDVDAQKARVRLYRDWRNSKIFKSPAACYSKAILGERVPADTLFTGVLHSEADE